MLQTVCRVAFWLLVLVACLAVLHQQRQLIALTEDVWQAVSAAEDARDTAHDAYSAADDARSAAEEASSSASEAADAARCAEDAVWAAR